MSGEGILNHWNSPRTENPMDGMRLRFFVISIFFLKFANLKKKFSKCVEKIWVKKSSRKAMRDRRQPGENEIREKCSALLIQSVRPCRQKVMCASEFLFLFLVKVANRWIVGRSNDWLPLRGTKMKTHSRTLLFLNTVLYDPLVTGGGMDKQR